MLGPVIAQVKACPLPIAPAEAGAACYRGIARLAPDRRRAAVLTVARRTPNPEFASLHCGLPFLGLVVGGSASELREHIKPRCSHCTFLCYPSWWP